MHSAILSQYLCASLMMLCTQLFYHNSFVFPPPFITFIVVSQYSSNYCCKICHTVSFFWPQSRCTVFQVPGYQPILRIPVTSQLVYFKNSVCLNINSVEFQNTWNATSFSVKSFIFETYFLNLIPNVVLTVHYITTPLYHLPFPGEYLYRKCLTLCTIVRWPPPPIHLQFQMMNYEKIFVSG